MAAQFPCFSALLAQLKYVGGSSITESYPSTRKSNFKISILNSTFWSNVNHILCHEVLTVALVIFYFSWLSKLSLEQGYLTFFLAYYYYC